MQICDHAVPFRSRLREIREMDERGQSLLNRTVVTEITQRPWAEYEAFASRDLSEFEVIYPFGGGLAERLHGKPFRAEGLPQAGISALSLNELRRRIGRYVLSKASHTLGTKDTLRSTGHRLVAGVRLS
jgi:hypothetical protein